MAEAKLVHELDHQTRSLAVAAFTAAHGSAPNLGFAPDRAWIEGYCSAAPAQALDAEQWTSDDCREFCAIGCAINRAAGHLPDHARVRIDLENGAGTAYWLDNASGAWRHIDSGDLFSTQIDAATDAAIAAQKGNHD